LNRPPAKWLLVTIFIVGLALLVYTAVSNLQRSSADEGGVSIGVHTEFAAACRAAFLRIASDMDSHPNSRLFSVSWSNSKLSFAGLTDDIMVERMEYERDTGKLTSYDYGGMGGWERVTKEMMLKSAKSRDPWAEFKQFGCRSYP
jgi:hypothetical protein